MASGCLPVVSNHPKNWKNWRGAFWIKMRKTQFPIVKLVRKLRILSFLTQIPTFLRIVGNSAVLVIPCFQKRLEPAKPLLCLEYSYLEIQIGFVLKHITYHLFMQNFNVVAPTAWLPHSFEWKCGEPIERLLMKLIDKLS